MNMIDGLIDNLHARYGEAFTTAGTNARCHWERLMERLEGINASIQNQGEDTLRINPTFPLGAAQPYKVRTLRTGEIMELETCTCDAAAGLLTITLDGSLRYAKTFTAADTRPGENLVLQGPGDVVITAAAVTNVYLQFKFMLKNPPDHPRKSTAGERGIGGVDPREAPGVADPGRHAPMGETMIGVSSID